MTALLSQAESPPLTDHDKAMQMIGLVITIVVAGACIAFLGAILIMVP